MVDVAAVAVKKVFPDSFAATPLLLMALIQWDALANENALFGQQMC